MVGLLAPAIGSAALGLFQTFQGIKGLNQLSKEQAPNYTVSPELQSAYGRAEGMTNQGFTTEQEGAFRQNLAQSNNLAYRRAVDASGGSMSGSILGAIQGQNIGALNQFAADDAEQRMQNIRYADSLASQLQNQQNMATQVDIENRRMKEQAYGGAVQSGLGNMAGSLNLWGALGYANQNTQATGLDGLSKPLAGILGNQPQGGLNLPTGRLENSSPLGDYPGLFPTGRREASARGGINSYNFYNG